MKKRTFAAMLLSFGLLFSACSGGGNAPETTAPTSTEGSSGQPVAEQTTSGGELIVAADQDPVGLDPHKVPAASSVRIYSLIYDTLVILDDKMNVQPSLAKAWEFSDDGKTLTMQLQQGVKFHNGKELTAEDVKYSFERILDPDTGSIAASYFSSVEAIETPDAHTVVFKLKNPDSAIIANMTSAYTAILSREVADPNTEAIGTGPFQLEKIEEGQYVLLKKNPDYFVQGEPKVDSLKFQIMKDEAERLAAVRTGKVDIIVLSPEFAQMFANNPDVEVKSYQSMEYSYLGINVAKKPLDDPRVRQAISYAVDRNQIVETVWKGEAVLTGPIAPAQETWALPTSSYASYKPDIEKAKQLLAEAGYPDGFETVIETASTYPDMIETAQVLQQQLAAIGIKAKINQLEWGNYIDAWKSKDTTMMVGRNTSGTDPDRSMRFFFATDGSANVWNYSNPAYDQLVQQALEATDPAERKKLYDQAQQMLVEEDVPNLFLASPKKFYAVGKRVEGFTPSSAGEPYALTKTSLK